MKDLVYAIPVTDEEDIKTRFTEAVESVTEAYLTNTWREVHSRCVTLIDNDGNHVEV